MEEIRSRRIYLVANRTSSEHCRNLIYSIRQCGCRLPIRITAGHFLCRRRARHTRDLVAAITWMEAHAGRSAVSR
jgi:hypothetical protein